MLFVRACLHSSIIDKSIVGWNVDQDDIVVEFTLVRRAGSVKRWFSEHNSRKCVLYAD